MNVWHSRLCCFKLIVTSSSCSLRSRASVFTAVFNLARSDRWHRERNVKPKPFKWTTQSRHILDKAARARHILEQSKTGFL